MQKIDPDIIHAGPIQRVALLPALANIHPLLGMSWGFDMLDDANRNNLMKWITHFVLINADWSLVVACCHRMIEELVWIGLRTPAVYMV